MSYYFTWNKGMVDEVPYVFSLVVALLKLRKSNESEELD